MNFETLGLRAELLRAVREQGYEQPTPIQEKAIPVILEDRDVFATAQTGTGKTAGFALPVLDQLMEFGGAQGTPRALVLAPTRELAAQIGHAFDEYGRHLPLRHGVIFGGVKFGPQAEFLRRGVDIVVATPGRLLDHLSQKTIDLSRIEILVLDEADRMLDMGFIHDIRRVLKAVPDDRQTLFFSATFGKEVERLARDILIDPTTIEIAPRGSAAETVHQFVHFLDPGAKSDHLVELIEAGDWDQVLVFTRTKHGANKLAKVLGKNGIEAEPIHGNKSQNARTRALADFKAGKVRVLVATDIASRGLDIEGLPHVVNYDLPNVAEDYVHRIGRTGRAGSGGEAVSLVGAAEVPFLRDIEKLIGRKLPYTGEPPREKVTPISKASGSGNGGRRRSQGRRRSNGNQASTNSRRARGGNSRGSRKAS